MIKAQIKHLLLSFAAMSAATSPALANSDICRMSDGFLDRNIDEPQDSDTAKEKGKGIGGTGEKISAIYATGTIYAFGSICMNGMRIAYDDQTVITNADGLPDQRDPGLGEVVSLSAVRMPNNSFRAVGIQRSATFEGRVNAINQTTGTLLVDGQRVVLNGTQIPGEIFPGATVKISGIEDSNYQLVASLIEFTPLQSEQTSNSKKIQPPQYAPGYFSYEGYVEKIGPGKKVRINGMDLDVTTLDCSDGPLEEGERVIAMGHIDVNGKILIAGFRDIDPPKTQIVK